VRCEAPIVLRTHGFNDRTSTQSLLRHLADGQLISGFRATAVYLNNSDDPIGARFVYERSGPGKRQVSAQALVERIPVFKSAIQSAVAKQPKKAKER
jgi:hypothetical protein